MAIIAYNASNLETVALDMTKAGVRVALLELENWFRFTDFGSVSFTDSSAVVHSFTRDEVSNLLHNVRAAVGAITIPTAV
jgi:hypothetical protein